MQKLVLLTTLFSLTACDVAIETAGYVSDQQTGLPLDAVQVSLEGNESRTAYSDADGLFYLSFITGAIFKPPGELPLVFSKHGYATDTLRLPLRDTSNVALQPLP